MQQVSDKKRKRVKLSANELQIHWTPEMNVGFKELTKGLCDMVMSEDKGLVLPRPDAQWLIRCEASDFALGAALQQMQPAGSWRPVAFYSQKLQGERAETTKEGFTHTKHTGQYGWTPPEKETYEIVPCLQKFQSWIGGQEIMVKPDHNAILEWYKEDLCTISGPLGHRGRLHEFLSRFNHFIKYTPGPDNHVGDALSQWAYPAGTAENTNFHGGDADVAGWQQKERKEREYIRQKLQEQYPRAYAAVHEVYGWNASVVESKLQLIRSYTQLWASDHQGREFQSSEELFLHTLQTVQDRSNFLSLPSSPSVRSVTATSRRQVTELYDGFNDMSWHMPGVHRYAYDVRDVKKVKIPPACAVLETDWTDHYRGNAFFQPHWEALETDTVLDINGCEYGYYQGKVSSEVRICPACLPDYQGVQGYT